MPAPTESDERGLLRVEIFSDAVFAIALTLLALDLAVSDYRPGALGDRLLEQWPTYLAFLGSFLFIAVMWLNHHASFQRLKAAPGRFLWANFGVLLGASVLPFPTGVLAEALQASNPDDERTAIIFYAGTATLIGLTWVVYWLVIFLHPTIWASPDDGDLWRKTVRRSIPGTLGYLVAGLVGVLITPELALAGFVLLPLWRRRTGKVLSTE
jgi:uncharacterized membrane protein